MRYSANSVWENKDKYDVVVIGAGHAGCEAALATARLGFQTLVFTVSVDSIAMMPCNPNIGGSSKGHLVRELDALGGEMGKVIDRTFIQSKMLNKSKGPAVHSLRAQADKAVYSRTMRRVLEAQENLEIKQGEVANLLVEDGKITGFKMRVEQSKLSTVKALQSIGFDTIASGDSYNDLGMIQASKAGFLFRSTDKIKADYPQIPAYETYDELLSAIKEAMK